MRFRIFLKICENGKHKKIYLLTWDGCNCFGGSLFGRFPPAKSSRFLFLKKSGMIKQFILPSKSINVSRSPRVVKVIFRLFPTPSVYSLKLGLVLVFRDKNMLSRQEVSFKASTFRNWSEKSRHIFFCVISYPDRVQEGVVSEGGGVGVVEYEGLVDSEDVEDKDESSRGERLVGSSATLVSIV